MRWSFALFLFFFGEGKEKDTQLKNEWLVFDLISAIAFKKSPKSKIKKKKNDFIDQEIYQLTRGSLSWGGIFLFFFLSIFLFFKRKNGKMVKTRDYTQREKWRRWGHFPPPHFSKSQPANKFNIFFLNKILSVGGRGDQGEKKGMETSKKKKHE